MKHPELILLLSLLLLSACKENGGIQSYTASENVETNIGTIKEIDGPVTFRLLARNDFADTLHPVRLYTPCGCTEARFDRKPIAPGEDEVIEVTYNPAYRPGRMMEEIQVYYINSPTSMRSFMIVGEVVGYNHPIEEDRPYHLGEGFYSSHRNLNFGHRRPGETADMFFRFGNGNTRKATVEFGIPDEWKDFVRMRQPGKMAADGRDTLHVKFTMPEGTDSVSFALQPIVNGVPTEEVIRISAVKENE